jgi:uncharacterized protein YdaU (DUF1376 family)
MAKFPAMPLWTDAYLADTRDLTTTEHGAYLLLLMCAWRSPDCALPNDDATLRRYAGNPKNWCGIWARINKFWYLEGGLLRQKRLSKERDWVTQKSLAAATNANAKWLKNQHLENANASIPHQVRNATSTHTHIKKGKFNLGEDKKARKATAEKSPAQPDVAADASEFVALPDSPEFAAWVAHAKATNKFFYNHLTETLAPTASFTFTSRWPPDYSNGKIAP